MLRLQAFLLSVVCAHAYFCDGGPLCALGALALALHTLCAFLDLPSAFLGRPCPRQLPGSEPVPSDVLWKHRNFIRPLQDYSDETPKVHPGLAALGE